MECHGSTGSVRQSSLVTITRGSRFDAHLQTSDVASHDSGTCVVTLRRSALRCGLSWNSAQQHSHHPVVIWSSSANQTQLLKKRKVRCGSRFPRKDWTSLDKAPHKAAEEISVVMARRSQKQTVSRVFLRRVMSTLHLSRTECVRIEVCNGRSAEQLAITVLRCMTSWAEDAHAGIGARATSKCTEVIIRATQTHDVLDEKKGRQSCDLTPTVQGRFGY